MLSELTGPWAPMTVDEVAHLLQPVTAPWWIAGGWAVDLHLGRTTRVHVDVDVLVLRPWLSRVQRRLEGWDLHAADPPRTLREWPPDEVLPLHVHDVWCRRSPVAPWCLQLMVDDVTGADDGTWIFRPDPRIRRAWQTLAGPASLPGRPVLTPEVQLLYKSRRPRLKDEADFEALAAALTDGQLDWLVHALRTTEANDRWLARLVGRTGASTAT